MFEQLYNYLSNGHGLSLNQFELVKEQFSLRKLKRKEFILREGETCRHMYFVNSGCLRFFTTNPEGQEMTRYLAFEDKFVTALTSFINQQPSFEFMQSVIESEVLVISRDEYYHLIDEIPEFGSSYRNMLEQAYMTSQQRIYGFQGYSALERLKWLMANHPKILSKLSSKVIASYLGVSQYTLSRLKAEL